MVADRYSQATSKASQKEKPDFDADGPAQDTPTEFETGPMSPVDGLKLLLGQLRELEEYLFHLLAAKTDGVKLVLRSTILRLIIAALGFVLASAFLVTACWFVLSGAACGLGILFGGRLWLGNLVTGILVLGGLGLGINVAVTRSKRTSRERTVKKYETRQARQQSAFGRSASSQS